MEKICAAGQTEHTKKQTLQTCLCGDARTPYSYWSRFLPFPVEFKITNLLKQLYFKPFTCYTLKIFFLHFIYQEKMNSCFSIANLLTNQYHLPEKKSRRQHFTGFLISSVSTNYESTFCKAYFPKASWQAVYGNA